jgi:hypothetical protein
VAPVDVEHPGVDPFGDLALVRRSTSHVKVEITSATDELTEAVVAGAPVGHRAGITHGPASNNLVPLAET